MANIKIIRTPGSGPCDKKTPVKDGFGMGFLKGLVIVGFLRFISQKK